MMTKDERKQESKTSDVDTITLNYRIDETPPWYLALFLGFQVRNVNIIINVELIMPLFWDLVVTNSSPKACRTHKACT